jgi:hypothetical protein
MEAEYVAQLLRNAGLVALVGDRITWDERDEGGLLPAVVLRLIDGPPSYTLKGRTGFAAALTSADCWGATGPQARAVADAFIAALDGLTAPFTQPGLVQARRRDSFRSAAPGVGRSTQLNRTSLDVRVWFSEA